MDGDYRLELRNVSKSFGEVHALREVDFQLGRNEVVGLLGDNGAGKSTLIKILTGYYRPDKGELLFEGQPVENLTVPKAAEDHVGMWRRRALAPGRSDWRRMDYRRA